MSPDGGGGKSATLPGDTEGARKRAAVETYVRHEAILRRTARRYSLCTDDADDALQRTFEILLTKAPSDDPRELIRWMQTVAKHEALATRVLTKRFPDGPLTVGFADWLRRQALSRPEDLLAFLEVELEIEWTDPRASTRPSPQE